MYVTLTAGTNIAGTFIVSPSGTQDVSIVGQTQIPLVAQLYSGSNLAGSITSIPSGTQQVSGTVNVVGIFAGTQDVNVVGDTVSLMKTTGGTIAQVTLIPSVTTVGTVSNITTGTLAEVTLVPTVTTVGTVSDITTGTLAEVTLVPNVTTLGGISSTIAADVTQVTSPWIVGGTVDIFHSSVYDSSSTAIRVMEVSPSGTSVTENVDIVGQSHVPLLAQLYAGSNVAGTMTVTQGTFTDLRVEAWLHSGSNAIGSLYGATSTVVAVQSGTYTVSGTVTSSFSPSGTQDVNIVGDTVGLMLSTGGTIAEVTSIGSTIAADVTQITSPWVISGTVTSSFSPSGTQDINIVGDTVGLMLSTGGTIAQVTLVPTVTTVGTVSNITTGTIAEVTSVGSLGGTSDVSIVSFTPGGTQDVGIVSQVGSSLTDYNMVNATTSASMLIGADSTRHVLVIRNQGTNDVYLGGTLVGTSRAILLQAGEAFAPTTTSAVYGLTASNASTLGYWEL